MCLLKNMRLISMCGISVLKACWIDMPYVCWGEHWCIRTFISISSFKVFISFSWMNQKVQITYVHRVQYKYDSNS